MLENHMVLKNHPEFDALDCKVGESFCYDKCSNRCEEFIKYLHDNKECKNDCWICEEGTR